MAPPIRFSAADVLVVGGKSNDKSLSALRTKEAPFWDTPENLRKIGYGHLRFIFIYNLKTGKCHKIRCILIDISLVDQQFEFQKIENRHVYLIWCFLAHQ